ncbi:hypothetical protein [Streptomyces longwoodensis]|uniref:hypothetical protein n=1 Tax=Streptomyces longwoodensis TaxID=68231 RepID=UPI0022576C28|nr:hypothetical protein [Streptomyces longwoodensis]MCX5000941.1 hypothetical protein [Streptomyces longwoodensis]
MHQPTTRQYPDAWHAAQDAQERAWLNDWMQGRICPNTLTPHPTTGHAGPALTTTPRP